MKSKHGEILNIDDVVMPLHNVSMADIMKKSNIKYWWGSRHDAQTFLESIKNGADT